MVAPPDPEGTVPGEHLARGRNGRLYSAVKVLLGMVLLTLVVTGGYFYNLGRIFDSQATIIENALPTPAANPGPVPAASPTATPTFLAPSGPMNILVLGSDSRVGAQQIAAEAAENGGVADQRADTIMLLHFPADRRNVYGISIMRDLWVDIPGYGQSKVNASLAIGGVPLVVQTVEALLSQHVDHVVILDFEGFKGLTDALGGVEMDVEAPFSSLHENVHFKKGRNLLNGSQALEFVRERYAFPDGDYQRVRNQQKFLKAVLGKSLRAGTLANPFTLHNAVSSIAPFISVDKGLNAATLGGLAFSLRGLGAGDAVFFTLPTAGTGFATDGQSIVLPDPAAIAAVAAALTADTLGKHITANKLQDGN
ncbi:LCP family protein [Micrococcaceae bacterium Sec5.7]